MLSLCTRTHPCETACPRRFGQGVPCIPTMPPPGQSVNFEYALVSKAYDPRIAQSGSIEGLNFQVT